MVWNPLQSQLNTAVDVKQGKAAYAQKRRKYEQMKTPELGFSPKGLYIGGK